MILPPFVAAADRGEMKIYRLEPGAGRSPAFKLDSAIGIREAHQRYGQRYTDQAGSFPTQSAPGRSGGTAERQSIEAETDGRICRYLARHLSDYLHQNGSPAWGFAAPAEINSAILNAMSPELRSRLLINIGRDIVKLPPAELTTYFSVEAIPVG